MKTTLECKLGSDISLREEFVGGKAARLAVLMHQGIAVPDGFCLTTTACSEGRQDFLRALIPRWIGQFDRGTSFLVRRSATGDDAATFPAGYESTDWISGANRVADAVIACLRGAIAPESTFIRHLNGSARRPQVAILVQRAISGDFSGVAFDIDPATGAAEVIVAACARRGANSAYRLYAVAADGSATQRGTDVTHDVEMPLASLSTVALLTKKVCRVLGGACEMTWILEEGTLWIVGVRRINSAAARESPEDLWSQANIREVVPERLTPLSLSAWQQTMELLFRNSFRHYRLRADKFQFIKNDVGGLWYNIGAINHLAASLGVPPIDLAIGGESAAPGQQRGGRVYPTRILRHVVGHVRAVASHLRLGAAVDQATVTLRAAAVDYAEAGERATSVRACLDLAGECYAALIPILKLYSDATSAAFGTLALLDFISVRWLPKDFSVASLLSARGAEVAAAGEALRAVQQNPKNRELVRNFLERFGHRGWQEVELMNPTWREIDEALWNSPPGTAGQPARRKRRPQESIPYELSGWRCKVFEGLAQRARDYATLRENVKHEFFRPIDSIRRLLRKAGELLATEGRIASECDVYFLTAGELEDLVSGSRLLQLYDRALLRHALWDQSLARRESVSPCVDFEVSCWRGLGASRGRAAGRARVLRSPHEVSKVRPGDILVAEALDVGWFPLFSELGGLVTALGGLLSHPCIIAREQGLPAVVGIRDIMERVQDGAWLVIDGDRGTVEMHPASDAARISEVGVCL